MFFVHAMEELFCNMFSGLKLNITLHYVEHEYFKTKPPVISHRDSPFVLLYIFYLCPGIYVHTSME